MSLIPTVYKSTDASAPTCSGLGGSLVSLLDAVLVNGYGSKAGLGWTIVDTGTNWRVYRHNPITGSGKYLYVNDAGIGTGTTKDALVRGYESWDLVNHVGIDPFPQVAQMARGLVWKKSLTADGTARPWMIVGNERSFYLFTDFASGPSGIRQPFFAGDFVSFVPGDQSNYLVSGGFIENAGTNEIVSRALTTGGGTTASPSPSTAMGYVAANANGGVKSALVISGAATLMATGSGFPYGSLQGGARPYPGPATGGLDTARILIQEGSFGERGEWPGIMQPLHSLPLGDLTEVPASGTDEATLLAVLYRISYNDLDGRYVGQVLLELGVEW